MGEPNRGIKPDEAEAYGSNAGWYFEWCRCEGRRSRGKHLRDALKEANHGANSEAEAEEVYKLNVVRFFLLHAIFCTGALWQFCHDSLARIVLASSQVGTDFTWPSHPKKKKKKKKKKVLALIPLL